MRTIKYFLIGIAVTFSGCQIGGYTKHLLEPFEPAARLQLKHDAKIPEIGYPYRLRSGLQHELLAIEHDGLLILAGGKIVFVPYGMLKTYSYDGKGPVIRKKNSPEEIRAKILNMQHGKLPLLIRFPQGVTPQTHDALLHAYEQDALIVVSVDG